MSIAKRSAPSRDGGCAPQSDALLVLYSHNGDERSEWELSDRVRPKQLSSATVLDGAM